MMRFDMQGGCPTIIAEVKNRYAVYLDNDSLIELNARAAYEQDHALRVMKPVPFDQSRPATYATVNLLRMLVGEWKAYRFTRNDQSRHARQAMEKAGRAASRTQQTGQSVLPQ